MFEGTEQSVLSKIPIDVTLKGKESKLKRFLISRKFIQDLNYQFLKII